MGGLDGYVTTYVAKLVHHLDLALEGLLPPIAGRPGSEFLEGPQRPILQVDHPADGAEAALAKVLVFVELLGGVRRGDGRGVAAPSHVAMRLEQRAVALVSAAVGHGVRHAGGLKHLGAGDEDCLCLWAEEAPAPDQLETRVLAKPDVDAAIDPRDDALAWVGALHVVCLGLLVRSVRNLNDGRGGQVAEDELARLGQEEVAVVVAIAQEVAARAAARVRREEVVVGLVPPERCQPARHGRVLAGNMAHGKDVHPAFIDKTVSGVEGNDGPSLVRLRYEGEQADAPGLLHG